MGTVLFFGRGQAYFLLDLQHIKMKQIDKKTGLIPFFKEKRSNEKLQPPLLLKKSTVPVENYSEINLGMSSPIR